MMIRFLTLIAIVVAAPVCAGAATPMAEQKKRFMEFEAYLKSEEITSASQLLESWRQESPEDVQLAVGLANLSGYIGQSINLYSGNAPANEGMIPNSGFVLSVQDPATSEVVGFLDTRQRRDDGWLSSSLTVLRDAVTTHPHRADIWMGMAHLHLTAKDYDSTLQTLRDWVAEARKNPGKQRWKFDESLDLPEDRFMPERLHAYALRGYREETSGGMELMLKVARLAQKNYPQHVYAYNDEAVYHNESGDTEKALESLLRAHKVKPDDAVITMNIAHLYVELGNNQKARQYLKLSVKNTNDPDLKQAAEETLEELEDD